MSLIASRRSVAVITPFVGIASHFEVSMDFVADVNFLAALQIKATVWVRHFRLLKRLSSTKFRTAAPAGSRPTRLGRLIFPWALVSAAKLNINWPADDQTEKQRSKLDERFLRSKSLPLRRSLPFFPDLHTEVSRSWKNPFSSRLFIPASDYYGNVAGLSECGYRTMPRVEQTLAGYLAPGAASSLKAPVLPTKPLRGSSALLGKGYAAAGQAGACLHTMAVLQAYQADLLKELDEGEQISSSDVGELRRTADLALRATKETASAIGRSMAAMVAAERHLWLTLSDMKEKDRVVLMDAPLAPSGLFGDAVNSVVDRFQEASKQAAAFQRFLPRRSIALGAAGREQPQPCTSSSYREVQRQSVASRAPQQRDRGRQRSKKSRPSETKPDLRVVLQSRKPSMKQS